MKKKSTERFRSTNFRELFEFYSKYVKLLYAEALAANQIPTDTLFEMNAAFDHISAHWINDVPEQKAAAEAFNHLRRSCLDLFKLKFVETKNHYDALCKIKTGGINRGEFTKGFHELFWDIRNEAVQARHQESLPDMAHGAPSFELWESVYVKCVRFDKEFFQHPELNWSKRGTLVAFLVDNYWGFIIGILASLIASLLWFFLINH